MMSRFFTKHRPKNKTETLENLLKTAILLLHIELKKSFQIPDPPIFFCEINCLGPPSPQDEIAKQKQMFLNSEDPRRPA